MIKHLFRETDTSDCRNQFTIIITYTKVRVCRLPLKQVSLPIYDELQSKLQLDLILLLTSNGLFLKIARSSPEDLLSISTKKYALTNSVQIKHNSSKLS